jgi:hypothetical protein
MRFDLAKTKVPELEFRSDESSSFDFTHGRVLDFDIEARPLGWYGGDFVHKEPTVIAAAWVDDPDNVMSWHIVGGSRHRSSMRKMLLGFRELYEQAGVVTGHYIRGYDLPSIQAACIEFDVPLLGPKLTSDTKGDLVKFQGVSKSQENLGGMLGTAAPKIGMNMEDWRRANRLDPEGIAFAVERCEGDVRQHIEMRAKMLDLGILSPPSLWDPGTGKIPGYSA